MIYIKTLFYLYGHIYGKTSVLTVIQVIKKKGLVYWEVNKYGLSFGRNSVVKILLFLKPLQGKLLKFWRNVSNINVAVVESSPLLVFLKETDFKNVNSKLILDWKQPRAHNNNDIMVKNDSLREFINA